jgi:integrase
MVSAWINELRGDSRCGEEDALFPATDVGLDKFRQFAAIGLLRSTWSNADPVRKIFRTAFESAGLPYFNPHSFRKTLARLGEQVCKTPEEFKAWSQNLGHEQVLTTFSSYGTVAPHRQAEIILGLNGSPNDDEDLVSLLARAVQKARGA